MSGEKLTEKLALEKRETVMAWTENTDLKSVTLSRPRNPTKIVGASGERDDQEKEGSKNEPAVGESVQWCQGRTDTTRKLKEAA